MPQNQTLTPLEASYIATNVYFTLKDWVHQTPSAGVESTATVHNRVLGNADVGKTPAKGTAHTDTSLKGTDLANAQLKGVHSAKTGLGEGVESGFGYTMLWEGRGERHAIIATRGTRPELKGKNALDRPDLFTDARAGFAPFGAYGPVHNGFKKTFDSLLGNLNRHADLIRNADVVHCVGHSLGGGVATLVAGHIAQQRKGVKLYSFGCPRVGTIASYQTIEKEIGKANIYRVAHDLDPIGLVAPYPYLHVNPAPWDANNLTLPSPTAVLAGTDNHDMKTYIDDALAAGSWDGLRRLKARVAFDDSVLAKSLLHPKGGGGDTPGWVRTASAKTLTLLFRLFRHVLATRSTTAMLAQTGLDLLSEILLRGIHKIVDLGEELVSLLRYAAYWAGITVKKTADFTATIIRGILAKMLAALRFMVTQAFQAVTNNLTPMSLAVATGFTMTATSAF